MTVPGVGEPSSSNSRKLQATAFMCLRASRESSPRTRTWNLAYQLRGLSSMRPTCGVTTTEQSSSSVPISSSSSSPP